MPLDQNKKRKRETLRSVRAGASFVSTSEYVRRYAGGFGSPLARFKPGEQLKYLNIRRAKMKSGHVREYHFIRISGREKAFWNDGMKCEQGSAEYINRYWKALGDDGLRWRQGYEDFLYENINRARSRSRKLDLPCDLDMEYLLELLESQGGRCPLTGLPMTLAYGPRSPFLPSLDRIEPEKGYVKGNVRFLCFAANVGRNQFGDETYIEICKAVAVMAGGLSQSQKKRATEVRKAAAPTTPEE